ncbi:glycosyltransferase [Methyloversatilis thermotolerans]|uniref:glycosyltransferase n=1 Tax=Methyloversatilis thermotolerans TaxID=1346290 RepID=UPI00039DF336|nr:glycosyltransferase [Methyloversatilis thermotolerans]
MASLAEAVELTVFFPSPLDAGAQAAVGASPHPYLLLGGRVHRPAAGMLIHEVASLCARLRPQVVVLSRLQADFLRQALPPGVRIVMDTHDLVSDCAASRRRAGVAVEEALGFEQEMNYLKHYDRVLLIQPDDCARVSAVLGERALCVPHPVCLPRQPVRPLQHVIGYAASQREANVRGFRWFAERVWPDLADSGASLALAGPLAVGMAGCLPMGMHSRGIVPDTVALWSGIDIAINPVFWGSGLKIKTVEALASGLPLVTTREGARGLEDGAGRAFIVADEADTFAQACLDLLRSPERRAELADAAHRYARSRFTQEKCFAPLLRWLQEQSEPDGQTRA